MQRKFLRSFIGGLTFFSLLNWNCTKVDTTEIGNDLIPAVDNIHTFADTLAVDGTQGIFLNDPTKVGRSDNHVLGTINNDPIFGKTQADIYLELKPPFFPYYFGNTKDTINNALAPGTRFDSVVLCLSYKGLYGDSTKPLHLSVYQLPNNTGNFNKDSSYGLNYLPDAGPGVLLGGAFVTPTDLRNRIVFSNGKDSVSNQIRIRITDPSFLAKLYSSDSSANPANNALLSDSLFKTFYKGLAVISDGAASNALLYVNLADPATRLEIHYIRENNNKKDTAFSSFPLSTGASGTVTVSSHANHLERDRTVSEFKNSPDPDALYIQATPGSYADLSIPGLNTFQNSIIHRAEIILEQIPGNAASNDSVLKAPNYLYLDIIDAGQTPKFKPIYYDLSPNVPYNPDNSLGFFPSGGIDFPYFGAYVRSEKDVFGNNISFYTFNVSRYVQNIVNKNIYNYKLRVYAPYNLSYYGYNFAYNNSLAFGRVKIGNSNKANYKLRMRIVYSKL